MTAVCASGRAHPCKHLFSHPRGTTLTQTVPDLLTHTHMPEAILNVGGSPFYHQVCRT